MADVKTLVTGPSVDKFIKSIKDNRVRNGTKSVKKMKEMTAL